MDNAGCKAGYQYDPGTRFFCQGEDGHPGEHHDIQGGWDRKPEGEREKLDIDSLTKLAEESLPK